MKNSVVFISVVLAFGASSACAQISGPQNVPGAVSGAPTVFPAVPPTPGTPVSVPPLSGSQAPTVQASTQKIPHQQVPVIQISDAETAYTAYTAGSIEISVAYQALAKSQNDKVRDFSQALVRDQTAMNEKMLVLTKYLGVIPQDNEVSRSLLQVAKLEQQKLNGLTGSEFDRAYAANEVSYQEGVLKEIDGTLLPSTQNVALRAFMEKESKLFHEHLIRAQLLVASLK